MNRAYAKSLQCLKMLFRRIALVPGKTITRVDSFHMNHLFITGHFGQYRGCADGRNQRVPFDDGFKGWGWEDVDWGLNVAKTYPVRHIDNTATHLGLDDTDTLLRKFGNSAQNFARLAQRHPDAVKSMQLYRIARKFRNLPARRFLQGLARFGARSATLPDGLRLACLKTYRALAYSREIQ